ncbi:MAG TPA: 6,7-dimethyl-8-ribityllumazine synthase [Aquifex aeolicus]|uniref:6,7-dimethyl-8-ribityllumazine synthase n=1 Tax=Aquifex aeolicus TaxID=63363 RepID=A0A9D0YQD3_AQUAO|nr:6,7-dimethyl-8-ribityllumazine synthase [Aquifex aeolicus]
MGVKVLEGFFHTAGNYKFGIVASRFNSAIVDRLVEGALDCLTRHGVKENNIVIAKVPGAWELPLAVKKMAKREDINAVIALGVVIRGATPHFEYVASEVSKGLAALSLEMEKPITFGIITADTLEQAIERAGTKMGNKGWEAAMAAIEMVNLLAKI